MTLGEIIREYTSEHSMSVFLKNSGLSKAYTYMLINNKNNEGGSITPSFETIKKVADGVGKSFDEVFNRLDYDFIVKVKSQESKLTSEGAKTLDNIRNSLPRTKEEADEYFLQLAKKDETFLEYMKKVFNLKESERKTIYNVIDMAYGSEKKESRKISTSSEAV